MSIVETRRGEYSLLEVELPGRAREAAGVLLHDQDFLKLRMRRDWSQIAAPAEEEVLEALSADLDAKIAEMGPVDFLGWMEETLSNTLRISERQPVLISTFEATLNRLYRDHVHSLVQPFHTHLPVFSCRAAAGKWGDQMPVEEEGWFEAPEDLRLTDDMFVAQVVGRSMEPLIADGSMCVFRANVVGSRSGKRLLIENFSESEQGGNRYTVKQYRSTKRVSEDGTWVHETIRLEPLNPEFETWEIGPDSCRVIGEFVRVLI
jgi:SOS-response transcriptional repressor LexA